MCAIAAATGPPARGGPNTLAPHGPHVGGGVGEEERDGRDHDVECPLHGLKSPMIPAGSAPASLVQAPFRGRRRRIWRLLGESRATQPPIFITWRKSESTIGILARSCGLLAHAPPWPSTRRGAGPRPAMPHRFAPPSGGFAAAVANAVANRARSVYASHVCACLAEARERFPARRPAGGRRNPSPGFRHGRGRPEHRSNQVE